MRKTALFLTILTKSGLFLTIILIKSGLFLTIALAAPINWSLGDRPLGLQALHAQTATPTVVTSPAVKVLTGLLAPDFQEEMNHMVQAVGGRCNTCHVRGNFASDENPKKVTARRMLAMTKTINQQFFPEHKTKPGESVLGRVTCYTCHQGETTPKAPAGQ